MQQVDLVQDNHLWPRLEAGAVLGQLAIDRPELLRWIACRGVDHVHQQPSSLQVREELVAEADALAGALDQPRDVRDGELPPVRGVHRAEHRLERRERVIRDLRLRVRDPGQKRRLAGVRQPHERGVGEQLQPQIKLGLVARCADLREARRLARGGRELTVAATAGAAAAQYGLSAGVRKIDDEVSVGVEDLRADRDRELDALAVGPVLAGAAAVAAAAALERAFAAKAREVAQIRVGDEHDVAAAAAVTAVGAAFRDVLLAPEAQRAVTAAPRLHVNAGAVAEHRLYSVTDTVRRSPLLRKASLPSRLAKIVSSLPMPVPGPGRKRVPRWRTMIIPAFTTCPSNSLTPRR